MKNTKKATISSSSVIELFPSITTYNNVTRALAGALNSRYKCEILRSLSSFRLKALACPQPLLQMPWDLIPQRPQSIWGTLVIEGSVLICRSKPHPSKNSYPDDVISLNHANHRVPRAHDVLVVFGDPARPSLSSMPIVSQPDAWRCRHCVSCS